MKQYTAVSLDKNGRYVGSITTIGANNDKEALERFTYELSKNSSRRPMLVRWSDQGYPVAIDRNFEDIHKIVPQGRTK